MDGIIKVILIGIPVFTVLRRIVLRKILIVVDMQNDFINGSLGTEEAKKIVPNVVNIIKEYSPKDIFVTRDTHPDNYLETQEGKNLPVKHCIEGTEGWELNSTVKNAIRNAEIINKPTFGSTELAKKIELMANVEPLEITLVGLCTDICVISNALLIKSFLPETPIYVVESCCAGVTPDSHNAAIATMKMCQINVI